MTKAIYFKSQKPKKSTKTQIGEILIFSKEFEDKVELIGLSTDHHQELKLSEHKIKIKGTKEKEFVLLFAFEPFPFVKTLSTPILSLKIDASIPLNNSTLKKGLRKKLRCYNAKTIRLNSEVKKKFYSLSIHNCLDTRLPLNHIEIGGERKIDENAKITLSPGEPYNVIFYDKNGLESINAKVTYLLEDGCIQMNPIFKKWLEGEFGNLGHLEAKMSELGAILDEMRTKENEVVVDLKNPSKKAKIFVGIKTPSKAKLGELVQLRYRLRFLGDQEKAFYVFKLEENDDEEILTFLNKTEFMVEFSTENEESRTAEIVFEALVLKSGVYHIPDLLVFDFTGKPNFQIFMNFEPNFEVF